MESISFFSSNRPALPLDIFSCSRKPNANSLEVPMTDGKFYNYRGRAIPKQSLKLILDIKKDDIDLDTDADDVDSGYLTGLIFSSERDNGIETLHIGLTLDKGTHTPEFQVMSFTDIFGYFDGVRLEDSGTFVGDYLVYVSTMQQNKKRRQPWTAVYRTHLKNSTFDRLTPNGEADLSPSVSPSGKKIAVASFQEKRDKNGKVVGWDGETEDLQTDIWVMDLNGNSRKLYIKNGGWPTWGSDNVIFFHRKSSKDSKDGQYWGVYKADITKGPPSESSIILVTPDNIDAMTPTAIDETHVVVATIREKSDLSVVERTPDQYRHIEIFDAKTYESTPITKAIKPYASHFDPFVLDGGNRIGYTTVSRNFMGSVDNLPAQELEKVKSPLEDENVLLYRTQGVFPTINGDVTQLAFVDNEFTNVWLVDGKNSPRMIWQTSGQDQVFGPVWDPVKRKDTLYISLGPSFKPKEPLQIAAIENVSSFDKQKLRLLTVEANISGKNPKNIKANNGFPSPSPDGDQLVFRSTRDGLDCKNLYRIDDTKKGESEGTVTRLTNGKWIDTQPKWSPNPVWIAFASNRDKPEGSEDDELNSGYFALYLLKADNTDVVIRVMYSGVDIAGYVNHPFFSPDGNTIVVSSDVAGVSVDPISLPLFEHSVRPYGDIFTVKLDKNIEQTQDVLQYTRVTHSRYENSTPIWADGKIGGIFDNFLNHKLWLGPAKSKCPCPPIAFSVGRKGNEKL